ncbi:hypothetical protein BGZ76_000554 [Entomortierella beljakovae]|nr:hypothetical protein BGZ76_000554 [Entomortierella beljakovae]
MASKIDTGATIGTNNVLANDHQDQHELDMEELIRIEEAAGATTIDGNSPTRYSSQTIRQKKGRQLASSIRAVASGTPNDSNPPSASPPSSSSSSHKDPESPMTPKNSEITYTTTTSSPSPTINDGTQKPGRGFLSVGLYQGLGRLQGLSAIAFGAFGFIHLVPPMLASVGGVELANRALIWGRVYYQTYGVEQVLVYGSLVVHMGTGLCRAIMRFVWRSRFYYDSTRPVTDSRYVEIPDTARESNTSSTSTTNSGTRTITTTTITTTSRQGTSTSTPPITSSNPFGGEGGGGSAPGLFPYHRLVGWLLTPLVLGHMNSMRLVPVKVLGDSSMLDYSFVTFLHRMNRPAPYLLLVCFMAYHMYGGGPVALNMALPKDNGSRIKTQELIKSKKPRAIIAGVVSTIALVGAFKIMNAEGTIPMARLYRSLL